MTWLFVDHLWQSTLVAALAGLLTLCLRGNRAQARYWMWLAASAKFIVPFTALVTLGSQASWLAPVAVPRMEVALMVGTAGVPFDRPAYRIALPAPPAAESRTPGSGAVGIVAIAVWILGTGMVLLNWAAAWRRVATIVRTALPVEDGRVIDALRRLERLGIHRRPIALVSSDTSLEPGVFGLLRPVLWWPSGLEKHLTDRQVEAILAHELAHVRRRDNLAAAAHMVVQALFWFNPIVWWIGRRLMDERERACDEAVIRWGSNRQVYAESILKTCRYSIRSPLACAAGVTGSDLEKRVESIMRSLGGDPLSLSKRIVVITVSVAVVAAPVVVGALSPRHPQAQTPAAGPTFEVASVKPNKSGDGRVMIGIQPGGRFTTTNAALRMLIRTAYQLQDFQIVGAPDWINSERFDIVAKAEGDVPPAPPGTAGPMQLMLRNLLAERFNLVAHPDKRELPIYAMVLARSDGKLGQQLRPSTVDCAAMMGRGRNGGPPPAPPGPGERPTCGMRIGPGTMTGGGFPLSQLATTLSQFVQRVVVDRTGLTGNYDLDLTWTPDRSLQGGPGGPPPPGAPPLPPIDPDGPSIFTAVQEQLGLKLDAQRGPVDVLVIDSVERPTPD